MSKFFDKKFNTLKRYVPGEQPQDKKYIKLNTNESPYPPSKQVIDSIKDSDIADLRLYSDPECRILKTKLADRYGVGFENIYLSNGSDDILNFAFMAYCSDGKGVAFADITYGFYSVYANLYHSSAEIVPLKDDFSIDVERFCGINKTVVLANPNAPTGIALNLDDIERIVASNPNNVVLIDEAYVDFGAQSCLTLLSKYDNLLIVRTFSKSRALAGARLGFAIGNAEIISDLETLRFSTNPYNVNRISLKVGAAAIDSDEYFTENCKRIVSTREITTNELKKLGFYVIDSKANFIFIKHPKISGEDLYLTLKDKGILIRHFSDERISSFNRVTIGSESEMSEFLRVVKEIISEVV
jgi:histidinol-phosphate aminotransferase